jgi:WD40 repeat protein
VPIEGLTPVGALALARPVVKIRFDPARRHLLALLAGRADIVGLRYTEDHDLEEQLRIDAGDAPVADLAYATGYEWFVTVGIGRDAEIWDPREARRKAYRVLPRRDRTAAAFARKSKVLLLGGASSVIAVDTLEAVRYGMMLTSGRVIALVMHPEDRVVLGVAVQEGGRASDVFFGRATFIERLIGLSQHDVRYHVGFPVRGAAFSPDGRSFALVGGDGALQIEVVAFPSMRTRLRWRAASTPEASLVESVGFDDTGSRVWLGTPGGTLVDLDAGSGEWRGEAVGHDGPVTSIDVRHGRRLAVTAGSDGVVKLWKMPDRRRRHDPDAPKLPLTEEFKGWHAPWTRKDVEGMRAFEAPEGMAVVGPPAP